MENKFFLFRSIEKKLWKDNIESNQYFASCSIWFCALSGAIYGSTNALSSWFDWDIALDPIAVGSVMILICGLNVIESIIGSRTVFAGIARSLLFVLFAVLLFVLGLVTSVVLLMILTVAIVLFVIAAMLTGGGSKENVRLSNGEKLKKSHGFMGTQYYTDKEGREWVSYDLGKTFKRV